MQFPTDYTERVYAGVLGKIIGVYLGRPIEGWTYEKITERFGEVCYYVHEELGVPLVVTDDDISGTFTFLRALQDYGYDPNISATQIGQTWLNYIVEGKSVLWWGGNGISTEHTAFLHLKHGIPAPESGSIARNGRVVAEQIGAQIFIDGWGLICPGDPERAVDFARRAASVSHDGEPIYGAQVVAALVAQAFVEQDIHKLIDIASSLIPADSTIRHMIDEIRDWHAAQPDDWRATRQKIADKYGYDKYGGGCHMVPNHALIIHALLHGNGDFSRSQMIINTCGWDTDCNAANVGCILGVNGSLAGIDKDNAAGKDWRGPVADRMFLPSADGGRCVTDAVQETLRIVEAAHKIDGQSWSPPREGARFSFVLPGSLQGFSPDAPEVMLSNPSGSGLTLRYESISQGSPLRVKAATFPTLEEFKRDGYGTLASPTLYPGQMITAEIIATQETLSTVTLRLFIEHADGQGSVVRQFGETCELYRGGVSSLQWLTPQTRRQPITGVGIEIVKSEDPGVFVIDYLTWSGAPICELHKPESGGELWMKAWVSSGDPGIAWAEQNGFRLCGSEGAAMAIQGAREWTDYSFTSWIKPQLADRAGIAGRVQGLKRYYALYLSHPNKLQLVKCLNDEKILAELDFGWDFQSYYELTLTFQGNQITALIDNKPIFDLEDTSEPLERGAVAVIVENGNLIMESVRVHPTNLCATDY